MVGAVGLSMALENLSGGTLPPRLIGFVADCIFQRFELVVLTRDKDHLDGSKNTVKTLHCEGATRHTLSTHRHMHTK